MFSYRGNGDFSVACVWNNLGPWTECVRIHAMRAGVTSQVRAPQDDALTDGDAIPTSPGSNSAERETPRVLSLLSFLLERLVARNEKYSPSYAHLNRKLTVFHGLRAPTISIGKYLERIYKYTNCSPSCFVVGYVYIDRLVHRQPDLPLISLNVHRLLVTSLMVAAKVLDDVHYNNAFYARVGGVSNVEINRLELELLFGLDFRVQVTMNVFESYCMHLEKEMLCTGQRIDRTLPNVYMPESSSQTKAQYSAAVYADDYPDIPSR